MSKCGDRKAKMDVAADTNVVLGATDEKGGVVVLADVVVASGAGRQVVRPRG